MAIKNRPHFIPKSFKYQPDYYMEFFSKVTAVFTHPVKHVTVYLCINADIWRHANMFDASGDLQIQYQADCRIPLSPNYKTLKDALPKLKKILSNEHFGETLKPEPVLADHSNMIKY